MVGQFQLQGGHKKDRIYVVVNDWNLFIHILEVVQDRW